MSTKAASIAPEQGRVVPAHDFDEDSICRRCAFDGAEWWHFERMKHPEDREQQPLCESVN